MVLYTLIFIGLFLDRKFEDKRFYTKREHAFHDYDLFLTL